MIKFSARCAAILSLAVPTAALAADFRLVCPSIFSAQAVQFFPAAVPAGWTPFMPSALEVSGGAMMFGPPATMTYSVPTSSTDGRHLETTTWRQLWEIPESEKWLSCQYGATDELTLSAPLPRDVMECTVKIRKGERGVVTDVSVQCKR